MQGQLQRLEQQQPPEAEQLQGSNQAPVDPQSCTSSAATGNRERAPVVDGAQKQQQQEQQPEQRLMRAAVWFHHIKSTAKRKNILEWARELDVRGASKPGFPGEGQQRTAGTAPRGHGSACAPAGACLLHLQPFLVQQACGLGHACMCLGGHVLCACAGPGHRCRGKGQAMPLSGPQGPSNPATSTTNTNKPATANNDHGQHLSPLPILAVTAVPTGVVICEGLEPNVREYLSRIRSLKWQAMQLRAQQLLPLFDQQHRQQGQRQPQQQQGQQQQQGGQQRFEGPLCELPETGMSELGLMCRTAGAEELFMAVLKL